MAFKPSKEAEEFIELVHARVGARTKAVLVASSHAFLALPHDADGLRMASRCKELRDRMVCIDLSRLYVAHT